MKTIDLQTPLVSQPVNYALLTQALRIYQANQRQNSARVKTRSEVKRTKKKWYRQKGTGNARHGARNPNIFVGGGVVHGPTGEQNPYLKLSQKMKQQALLSALALQAKNIKLDEKISTLDGKTKTAMQLWQKELAQDKRLLIITDKITPKAYRSTNNLNQILLVSTTYVNLLHIAQADTIILNQKALQVLTERLLGKEK